MSDSLRWASAATHAIRRSHRDRPGSGKHCRVHEHDPIADVGLGIGFHKADNGCRSIRSILIMSAGTSRAAASPVSFGNCDIAPGWQYSVNVVAEPTVPLAEAAYRCLRDEIIACRLQPGQRITERALAGDFGFGVAPIRDALTRLDHDGLVRTIPRKGYQVAPLTLKAVDDLFAFWSILGPEIVKRGIVAASDEQLGRIIADFEEMERSGPAKVNAVEMQRFVEAGADLFNRLADAAGNAYLSAAYAKLSGEMLRVFTLITDADLTTPKKLWKVSDWSEVLRQRDGEGLSEKARDYINACHDHVAQTLMRWPSVMMSEVVPQRAL
ncbi:GntR family transcriptional regulator [Mycobacterium sp. 236(2023)]|uniref:GntR family transcriptional regulator n=1 Tax=Mycobacterium sp. 236(2023) TaxID=3038163 RepID=UPI002415213C|nr:GntR family transcriptional regulator [Mycobacterium sp. 236(2023)]MDG4668121.1 GntR family transcriptional regulator [Mycobacterium sp. 236(2023)]